MSQQTAPAGAPATKAPASRAGPGSTLSGAQPSPEAEPSPLQIRLRREAQRVGQTTDDPKTVEKELNDWGQSLTPEQVQEMRDVSFLGQNTGDEVALALDLLGRSDLPEATQALIDYVMTGPAFSTADQSTFQLLALDGLIDKTERSHDPRALQKIQADSSDALVSRRAAQALGALKGKNPWPRQVDEKALQELLQKSAH